MDCYGYFYRPFTQEYTLCEEFYNCTGETTSIDDPCDSTYPILPIQYNCQMPPQQPPLWSYGSDICSPPCTYNYVPCEPTPPPSPPCPPPPYRPPSCSNNPMCIERETTCVSITERVEPVLLPTIYKKYPRIPGRPRLIAEYVDVMEPCGARRVYAKTFNRCAPVVCYEQLVCRRDRRKRHKTPRRKSSTRVVYVDRPQTAPVTPAPSEPCCSQCAGYKHNNNHSHAFTSSFHNRFPKQHEEHVYENEMIAPPPPPPPPKCMQGTQQQQQQRSRHSPSYGQKSRKKFSQTNHTPSYNVVSTRHCPCEH